MIVDHCSATEEGVEVSVETLRRWHKNRGFKDVGYHVIVHLDGSAEEGRDIREAGAHAKGYNEESIGICYIGGLKNGKPADTRTEAQKETLKILHEKFKKLFDIKTVKGHRDLSVDLNGDGVISKNEWMKACPCYDAEKEYG